MAFINQHTSLSLKTELDLFALPPTQNSVEYGHYTTYRPLAPLTNDSPIEFVVAGTSDEYIDLAHTMIYLQVKIIKNENPPLIEGGRRSVHNVAPVNNWLHSMFTQVDVYLNQKSITPPSNNYNYRAYIENLLNYGKDAKKTHLQSSFWYKDTAEHMEAGNQNLGYEKRKENSSNNTAVDLFGNLHCDIFNQDKYLLNGVELSIKLNPSKPQFHLLSDQAAPNCTFEILTAELFVRKVKINPTIQLGHAEGLLRSNAKYPITRVDIKQITLPAPIQNKTIDNLYIGQLPKRCIIGMVRNTSFNGSYTTNPFNFEHFNLNYFSLYIDSIQIPSKPFTPNFLQGNYMREYNSLFSGSGIHYTDNGNDISHSEYPNGFFLLCFDLTPDLSSNDSSWNIQKNGTLRIELRFAAPLVESVTVILYSEFDNLIEIDRNRQVTVDYSS
jgi:hypothetical protein